MTVPAIFVLGMHRSGTSALSRVLNLLGYGEAKDLMKANGFNPSGYWEPQPVVALNDAYLWDLKRYWGDPKPIDLTDDFERYDAAVNNAEQVLRQQFDLSNGFVVKDPRVSLTFPAWREAAVRVGAQPLVLIALRNPLSVCRSLRRRDGIKVAHAEKLWMNYTLEAEKRTRGIPRAVVRYEHLLQDWHATLEPAFQRLEQIFPDMTNAKRQAIEKFLDAGLNHGEANDEHLMAHPHISQETKDLYGVLSQPGGLNDASGLDGFYSAWRMQWAEKSKGKGASFYAKRFPDWHLRASAQFAGQGDLEQAIGACETAIEIAPDLAQSHFRLAKLLFDQESFQDALEPICAAADLSEPRLHIHMLHARILTRLERFEEALEQAARAIGCNDTWPEAHFVYANLLLRLDQREQAIPALERAIRLGGSKLHFHKALARAKQPRQEGTQAPRSHYDPKSAQAQTELALRYLHDKNWRAAHQIYVHLAEPEDAPFAILQNHLTALLRLGMVQDAIATLKRIVVLEPLSARHHFLLGAQYVLAAQWDLARHARDKGLALGGAEIDAFLSSAGKAENAPNPYMSQSLFAWQSAGMWHEKLQSLTSASGELWPLGAKRPILEKPKIAPCLDTDRPELSVMIPTYNVQNGTWLRGAIESVLSQTDPSEAVEIVIIDDASSNDVACAVAEDYGPRIHYIRNDVQAGLLQNHNRCLELARGKFVHILHQDDWVRGGFYDALLAPLRADASLSMAFCAARIVDGQDKRLRVPARLAETAGILDHWTQRIVHGQLINFPTVIARRSTYEAVGGFTPSLSFAFDWEMWARLASAGHVWHDPRELAVYRNHEASATHLFTARERLIDTFHTIAGVLPLLPKAQADEIGRHALQRVLANGWGQLRHMDHDAEGVPEMLSFLQQGCSSGADIHKVMALFD